MFQQTNYTKETIILLKWTIFEVNENILFQLQKESVFVIKGWWWFHCTLYIDFDLALKQNIKSYNIRHEKSLGKIGKCSLSKWDVCIFVLFIVLTAERVFYLLHHHHHQHDFFASVVQLMQLIHRQDQNHYHFVHSTTNNNVIDIMLKRCGLWLKHRRMRSKHHMAQLIHRGIRFWYHTSTNKIKCKGNDVIQMHHAFWSRLSPWKHPD